MPISAFIRVVAVVIPLLMSLLSFPLAQTEGHSAQLLGPIPAFLIDLVLLLTLSPLVGLVLLVEGSLHLPLELFPHRERPTCGTTRTFGGGTWFTHRDVRPQRVR